MKKLLTIMGNYGRSSLRRFIFVKDQYGHDRVNITTRNKFFLKAEEIRMLLDDSRFDNNTFITDDRIIFNGVSINDLSEEERKMYEEDIIQ